MTAEEWVFDKLNSTGEVLDLVADRIFPQYADSEDKPYIVYAQVGYEGDYDLAHELTEWNEVRVDYWSETYTDLLSLGEAIRLACDVHPAYLLEQSSKTKGVEEGFHCWQIYRIFVPQI